MPKVVHTGFYRSNLELNVIPTRGEAEKRLLLLEQLQKTDGTGIIYSATIKAVEELTAFLKSAGLEVDGYHGRLSARRRAEAQDRFMADEFKALVATNAFGLGIDKRNIRFVLHYHLPGTTEAFYQEFGRPAGTATGHAVRCSTTRRTASSCGFFRPRATPTATISTTPITR